MFADESSVRIDVSRAAITSNINRARYPQSLVRALTCEDVSHLLAFDYCSLLLPESDGRGTRIWRASRLPAPGRVSAADDSNDLAQTLLARLLDDGLSRLIEEGELQDNAAGEFGDDVKSALALPLSFGGKCFGLLCFASTQANAYTKDDTERLMWLADHVASTAQAILLRIRLDSMNEGLLEMERLKSGFVNTLVRDIRLPLTSVLGLLELFESKLQAREQFDMEDRQLLNSAIENGDRMRHLLDNHLEIARQHEQPLTLTIEEAKVEQMLEEVAEPLRGEAALRGVEMNINVGARDLSMRVDARQTRRALCHLLTVALAATPDGGAVQIEAQTIMGTRIGDEGRRFVIVSISDSSQGIPPEEVPFVFDAFWQASDNRNAGGHGVGLAIAKRIAAAHGGNVAVRSQRGRGTIYSLVLPAGQQVAQTEMRRVLIVDDAPELLLLLRKLVARMGYQVEIASGAVEALEILRAKTVDLLLTDWSMPGMNGGELIAALKEEERLRLIPTIVLTGHDTDNERLEAERVGCDRFLVKPIMRDNLQRIINELLPAIVATS
ncbi:MAG TPA: response regulator [Pyrinomonadaceae bacterium]|jgi:signal transduction histidine kinase/CheY-like chemotaxis protein|nr:response regulator [Pyrinomonadaceae bacterium]